MNSVFITGTDTGVGKTHVAASLIQQYNNEGYQTFGIKPIASGCSLNAEGQLVNDDALILQKMASIKRPYNIVNPLAFKEPIAPHLAANIAGVQLSVSSVVEAISQSIQSDADVNIIEGVGGWSVPLNDYELVSEVVKALEIPTILVVGIKLGCLNHAILTAKSIEKMGVPFVGWIANCIDPETLVADELVETLKKWLPGPLLGVVPHGHDYHSTKKEFLLLKE